MIEIHQPESNLQTPAMNCCEGMQCLENQFPGQMKNTGVSAV